MSWDVACDFAMPWQSDIGDGVWCRNDQCEYDECPYFTDDMINCKFYQKESE